MEKDILCSKTLIWGNVVYIITFLVKLCLVLHDI